jgi:ribonuclease HI
MYYAVKKGHQTGIFESWEICKQHIHQYSGAVFKKFKTKQDALNFLNGQEEEILKPYSNIYVYCDGSCIHNGKPNAKAGIGIYFGDNDPRNVSESISGNTNNISELTAMIRVYDYVKGNVTIVSDSKYALHCVKEYGKKQEKDSWKNNIPNQELVKQLYETYKHTNIQFMHVYAHTNKKDMHSIGNAMADKLAYDSVINN